MTTPKSQRFKNFSSFEVLLILDLLTPQRLISIESKRTDNFAVQEKNRTWVEDFHAQGGGKERDVKSIKHVWKRLKEQTKKRTCGGQRKNILTAESAKIRGTSPTEQLYPPLQSPFDCDCDEPPSKVPQMEEKANCVLSVDGAPNWDVLEVAALLIFMNIQPRTFRRQLKTHIP